MLSMTAQAQTVVESFEYGSEEELAAAWMPSANAVLALSDSVAPGSSGKTSLSVTFNFPSTAWATESVKGVELSAPIVIGTEQFVTLRIKGDPAFSTADFRNFYLYAYDVNGNFGRWGASVPTKAEWQALSFSAAAIEKPWDSPELPDLGQIMRFAIFQYGSQAAIPAYTATVLVDDLVIRDAALVDDAAPPFEGLVEGFEYPGDAELGAAWKGSAHARLTLSTAVVSTSSGQKAMKVEFDFPSSEWATESVKGPVLETPVSIGTNQFVTLRLKGDPAFAVADFRNFYLYAYDLSGNFGRWGTAVPTNSDWQVVNFTASSIEKPWDSPALPNLGKIVQFALFQYGSQAAISAYRSSLEVDDLMIRNAALNEAPLTVESVVEPFEYGTDDDLLSAWTGSPNALLAMAEQVAPRASGRRSLSVTFNFASTAWATEFLKGPTLPEPLSIGPKQYLTLRVKGDPAFAAADFRTFFLYAYDDQGNFGRWGSPIPTDSEWHLFNFSAGGIQKPWDSPGLPDLGKIVRFAIFQYGSEAAIPEYSATILVDELMLRNTPLVEFPAPASFRSLLEDFETYATTDALGTVYSYQNSPAATRTVAALESPAPQGAKALKMTVDFAAGQYPWGSVRSAVMAPFSFPSNGIVSLRLKGDTALAALADGGTSFWLSLYDKEGRGMNFITTRGPLLAAEWTTLEASLTDFGDTSTVDVGNLVQWRLLVQAYEGTAEHAAMSATIYLDDLRIGLASAEPPVLAVARDGASIKLTAAGLVVGKSYVLESSTDLKQWTGGAPVSATTSTSTWTLSTGAKYQFYRVAQKPL